MIRIKSPRLHFSSPGRVDIMGLTCSNKTSKGGNMQQDEHFWCWCFWHITRHADSEAMLLKAAACCW